MASMGGELEKGLQVDGGTDGTTIGNVSDRLKVDSSFSSPPQVIPSLSGSALRILDMGVANGGVARDTGIASTTVYTTILSLTGSGYLSSFLVSLEGNLTGADAYDIRLEIDGTVCFTVDTTDVGTSSLYNLLTIGDENTSGISLNSNVFRYAAPRFGSLRYSTSLKIYVKKVSSATSKKFRAGMVHLTV